MAEPQFNVKKAQSTRPHGGVGAKFGVPPSGGSDRINAELRTAPLCRVRTTHHLLAWRRDDSGTSAHSPIPLVMLNLGRPSAATEIPVAERNKKKRKEARTKAARAMFSCACSFVPFGRIPLVSVLPPILPPGASERRGCSGPASPPCHRH